MSNVIVVGLDPERANGAPLTLAARLAQLTGAALVAVAAYVDDPITNAVSAGTVDEEMRHFALARLAELTSGVDADLMPRRGSSPARVLQDAAVQLHARLIVVGSTSRGRIGRIAPGSTAERLLHGAPCPVIVAPSGLDDAWRPETIGVGFVDLPDGHEALRAAAALAATTGSTLHAMTAVEPHAPIRSAAIPPYRADGVLETATAAARNALERALYRVARGMRTEAEVMVAEPAAGLVDLSRRVDLLVCGSRGYGPARSVLVGGVAHRLVGKAHCPVLIVPRGAADSLAAVDQPVRAATS
jgi:nucleotide-binding universal stress UspA family protein